MNNTETKKYGYKGLSHEMKVKPNGSGSKQETYELNVVYSKNTSLLNPRLCTNEGYHYCDSLEKVDNFYSLDPKIKNRFFKIEVLGAYTEASDKCITTSFKIVEEVTEQAYALHQKLEEKRKQEEQEHYEKEYLNLPLIQELQKDYPELILSGSVSLYLRGLRLKRFNEYEDSHPDIDLISPYYINFTDIKTDKGSKYEIITSDEDEYEGNDFLEINHIRSVQGMSKYNLRVDPSCKYEFIEYKGFKYKVALDIDVIEAKLRYARQGNKKHRNDILEILNLSYGRNKK